MISIIIPAYNEERYIQKTIESIHNSNFKDYEIIVACDNCSDRTEQIAKDNGAIILRSTKNNIGYARNLGAKAAKGDYFLFLDADTLIDKNLLHILQKKYKNGIAVCKVKPDNKKLRASALMALKNLILKLGLYRTSNGMLYCSRDLYNAVGGFPDDVEKREEGIFVRKGSKKTNFQFLTNSYVITSMRRYEKIGYFGVILYWIKTWLTQDNKKYPVVR